MVDGPNDDELPDFVDSDLVFEAPRYPGRNFLIGNAHTSLGRMEAYSEIGRYSFAVSLDEMTHVSPAARAWISGFFVGSEPDSPEYTGDDHADELEAAWRAAVIQFETNGELPVINEEWVAAAQDRIRVAADGVKSQTDFADFLRVLDANARESSGTWMSAEGEYFFNVWAAILDSNGGSYSYGLGDSVEIAADWHQLAISILRVVLRP